ncbi:hypothetical protein GCM10028824_04960 [Hymenobacter segetis]
MLLGLALLSACVNTRKTSTVYLPRGQTLYRAAPTPTGQPTALVLPRRTLAQMSLTEQTVAITLLPTGVGADTAVRQCFFASPGRGARGGGPRYYAGQKLHFFESYPIFQAITVPVKLRPGVGDTLGSRAGGGFDVGISWGWKNSFHTYQNLYYRPTGQFLSRKISQFSLVPGAFLTVGTEELNNDKNNVKHRIHYIREVPILSPGGYLVIGVNRANVGFALGADFAIGPEASNWIYHGRLWLGLVLSVDLLASHDPFDF